jgi:hypothetical protein
VTVANTDFKVQDAPTFIYVDVIGDDAGVWLMSGHAVVDSKTENPQGYYVMKAIDPDQARVFRRVPFYSKGPVKELEWLRQNNIVPTQFIDS